MSLCPPLRLVPVALLAVVAGAEPASASSCAGHVDGSPAAIAAGSEQLAGNARFFDSWRHLLLGRVVAVDEDRRSPTAARTLWTVEVVAALGGGEMPSRVVVGAPDTGGNGGYPFTLGEAFAIPVRPNPDLGGWSSFICDPITPLDDLDAAVEHVLSVAVANDIPVATVHPATPATGGVPAPSSEATGLGALATAGAGALVLVTGTAVVALWCRRSRGHGHPSARRSLRFGALPAEPTPGTGNDDSTT